MPTTWIWYPFASHNMLLCTRMIKILVHLETSPVVSNTSRSLKLIKVLSHRGRKSDFHSQLIVPSYKILQTIKEWMTISGNWTRFVKSTSITRVCSTFPVDIINDLDTRINELLKDNGSNLCNDLGSRFWDQSLTDSNNHHGVVSMINKMDRGMGSWVGVHRLSSGL